MRGRRCEVAGARSPVRAVWTQVMNANYIVAQLSKRHAGAQKNAHLPGGKPPASCPCARGLKEGRTIGQQGTIYPQHTPRSKACNTPTGYRSDYDAPEFPPTTRYHHQGVPSNGTVVPRWILRPLGTRDRRAYTTKGLPALQSHQLTPPVPHGFGRTTRPAKAINQGQGLLECYCRNHLRSGPEFSYSV